MTYKSAFKPSVWFIFITLVMCSAIQAAPRGPLVEKTPSPRQCEYPSELSGIVQLDPDCYYEQAFEIREPDTILDCRGAEIRGSGEYLINIKRDADRAKVINCYLTGGKGLAVRVRQPRNDETVSDVRALGAHDITIQNVQISHSEGVGIHLHVYTTGVTIKDSIITDNSSAGIYLSPYGQRHHIQNNLISGNGHTKPDGVPRVAWYRREGIAIDAASENIIMDNEISNNSFGGILLYKNCWEHAEAEPNSRPRTEHARANLIQGNRFSDQPFGVWVAARQSRDLEAMECGDPTPYDNPIDITSLLPAIYWEYPSSYVESYLFSLNSVFIWPDFAEENVIIENHFENISLGGIRIEDNDTEVSQNLFFGDFDYIFLGAPFRARLTDQPIENTIIQSNAFVSEEVTSFSDRLALMPDEHLFTILEDNHRACLLDDGHILFHGELINRTLPSDDNCSDTQYRCLDGILIELESACQPVEDRYETDQMILDQTSVDQMPPKDVHDLDVMHSDLSISSDSSSNAQNQGCMTSTHSLSLTVYSLSCILMILLFVTARHT